MAKRSSRRKKSSASSRISPAERERRAERDLATLMKHYRSWREAATDPEVAEGEAQTLTVLLRMKREHLGSPGPAEWDLTLLEELLLYVAPRKWLISRVEAMNLVPALVRYFDFLEETDRWRRAPAHLADLRGLLDELELEVLEAFDDPTRRSSSGNVLTYAMDAGVDLADKQQFDDFMHWYNNQLTREQRTAISDTGRLPASVPPYVPGAGEWAEEETAPEWPWFLPDDDELERRIARRIEENDGDANADIPAEQWAQLPLVQRAVSLLELVGERLPVTDTGALQRADLRKVVESWGLTEHANARSMWDVLEVKAPWTALCQGGWVEVGATRAVPGKQPMEPYVALEEDPEGFSDFAKTLLNIALTHLVLVDRSSSADIDKTMDFLLALTFASAPEGLQLPPKPDFVELYEQPERRDHPIEEYWRLAHVAARLDNAADIGLVWKDADGKYHGNLAGFLLLLFSGGKLRDLLMHEDDEGLSL